LHPGPYMMLEFDAQCRSKHGQEPIEVPLPFGVAATDRFYAAIAAGTGRAPLAGGGPLAEVRDAARAAIDAYRAPLHARVQREHQRPPRCAFNIGSFRSFDLR